MKSEEFYLATSRIEALIRKKKELALELKNKFTENNPKELQESYEELEESFKKVINQEARFLANLE